MKKNLKRWLALLLAIAMVVTSGAFTNLTYLRATDSETPVETQSEQKEEKQEAKTEEKEKEKEQKIVVEPKKDDSASKEEKKEDSSKEDKTEEKKEETASEPKKEETVSEEKKQDTASEEKTEEAASEQKGDTSAKQKEETPAGSETAVTPAEAEGTPEQSQVQEPAPEESQTEEAEEKTYEVKIEKPDVDGGSVKAWSDGEKADVSDGGTQTVKEGQTFTLQIATKEGYSVEKVADQDQKTIEAKEVKDNTYTYELNDVRENRTLNIVYKEEKQDEVAYPAFSYSGSKDGVKANISAPEGVFPEGTEVELKALSADDRAAIAAAAGCDTSDVLGLDITFTYEGKDIQPTGDVSVSFSADEIRAADEVSVYHVTDGGSVDKIGGSKDGASVGFTADSFSPYGVVVQANAGVATQAAKPSITLNPTSSALTYIGQTATISATVKNAEQDTIVTWSSSDPSVATVVNGVVTAVGEGTAVITASITPDDGAFKDQTFTATASVKVAFSEYKLYYYALIPGKTDSTSGAAEADASWLGMGVTKIKGVPSPSSLSFGTQTGLSYTVGSVEKALYPDIKINNKIYKYAVKGSEESYKEGYYTLEPYRLVVSQGTNAGNNGYNPIVGGNTYHLDHTIVLNEEDYKTVTFNVKYPGETEFASLTDFSQRVRKDTAESTLKRPTTSVVPATQVYNGVTYRFEGWYTDEDCTISADFAGTITANKAYYARYVPVNQKYTVEYYYEGVRDDARTEILGPVTIGDQVTTYTDRPRAGYQFDKVEGAPLTISATATDNVIRVYYIKTRIGYTVNYYLNGTTDKVADSKTGGARFEEQVTEFPAAIEGYTIVPAEDRDKKITMSASATENVINFYYYKNVTLVANSAEYTYDGNEKSVSGYTLNGEAITLDGITAGAKGTAADSYAATFTGNPVGTVIGTTQIVTATENGLLKINPIDTLITVTIKEHGDIRKYNGEAQTVTGYDVKSISGHALYTANDFRFKGEAGHQTVTGTDAGTYDMELLPGDFENTNRNFSNVKFVIEDGTLVISPRNVTLVSGSDSKAYDGTALTKHEVTVDENSDRFVDGESYTYTVTGSRTEVGESDNDFEYDLTANTKAGNYNITKQLGKLTVTPDANEVVVTITENSGTVTYDGTEQSVTGYEITSISNSKYLEDYIQYVGTPAHKTATGTDAGTYDMGLTAADFENTNANYSNVRFVIVDGTLTIQKRQVTLTSDSADQVYNGRALESKHVTIGGAGFVSGQGADFTVTGSQTDVGETANSFSYKLKTGTDPKNYDIEKTEGKLKVTPVTDEVVVTITEHGGTFTYDGTEQKVTGYDVSSNNALYTESDFSFSGKAEVQGKNAGTYEMELKPSDFKNTSKNFTKVTFKIVDASLHIEKREVTLTSATDEKTYDGTALRNSQITVGGAGFVKNEGATYTVTGEQLNAGSSDNAFTYDLNEGTLAGNYAIIPAYGKLTVKPVETEVTVTITGHTATAKYDAGEHMAEGYDIFIDNSLYTADDFTFEGTASASRTDAGSTPMGLATGQFTNISDNFTNVTFVVKDGGITVEKRKVTLTSATDSKAYDGEALTNDTVTVGGEDGFVEGQGATYSVTGSQTVVGSSPNRFTYQLNEGTKADNYDITKKEGTLTVTEDDKEVIVTISGNSKTVKYDGKEQTVTGYTVVSISNSLYTEADFTFKGTAEAKGTNADTYKMGLTAANFENNSSTFTNVKFEVTDGTLTIQKRDVTLTSASAEKVYDGTALTNDEVTVSEDKFAEGEGATYTVTGNQTVAGSSKNAFTYDLNENTDAKNYNITVVPGELKVTPVTEKVTVTVKGNSDTQTYDGKEKTVTGYKVESISNPLYTTADFTFSGDAAVSGTDATTYDMHLDVAKFKNTNKNFTTVEFVTEDGQLVIEKRQVTLTSANDRKVYDGNALTNGTVDAVGFVEGQGATYKVTGTQTDVGTSKNTFTYELTEGTDPDNYAITTEEGTLEVTPVTEKVTVTITEHSGNGKYDGHEKKVTGYDVAISNRLYKETDFSFTGNAEIKGTNAGTYDMELVPENFANISKNFTNVEFVILDGQLTIAKRQVTLTSASDSKVYDGTALTNHEVKVSVDGFAEGEGATYTVTGSRTVEGSSPNTFTFRLNDNTKEENYDITKVTGTLTVTKSEDEVVVTIAEKSGTFKYDGTQQTVSGYEVRSISNPLYKATDFTFSGNATVSGTDAGTYEMNLTPADFTNTNTNFKKVTFVIEDGELVITPRSVTMTSVSASKTYDGTPLTNSTVNVTGEGFVGTDGASYTVTGSQTNAGESANSFTYELTAGTNSKNYSIEKNEGKLLVNPVTEKVTVKIKGNRSTTKYDASVKAVSGYTMEISNPLYTTDNVNFTGMAKVEKTNAGKYPMGLTADKFSNTGKNFTNVEFVIEEDGLLEIQKREVKLTSASDRKVYDGEALTNDGVKVDGDGFAAGEGASYTVTGTQTETGKSENVFSYTLNKGTLEDNYTITKANGELEVTPITDAVTVTVKEHGGRETYDGTAKTVTGYDVIRISHPLYKETDFEFTGDATVTGTNARTYPMNVKATEFKNISKNFTNVSFVVEDDTLVIAKRNVTMTSASDSKVYDGTPLTNDGVEISGEGFVEGQGVTCTVTGSQTVKGSSENTFSYTANPGTDLDNYEITQVNGMLTVTATKDEVVVTITENSDTVKYDGEEKTVTGYTVTAISNPLYTEDDFSFSGNDTVSGTDAGSYDMQLKPEDFTNNNANFKKVTFQIVDGKLTIEKRSVILTSASQSKVYDGRALTNGSVDVSGEGFVKGDDATYQVTGRQLNVGSSKNTFTYELTGQTKADNYDITVNEGDLTVTPVTSKVTVTIKGHTDSAMYDGTEKSAAGYDTFIDNPLYTTADFSFTGNAEAKGKDADTYAMGLKASEFRNISKNFTNVEFKVEDGKLTIGKRTVILASETASKTYDGTALTRPDVTVTGDGFVDDEVTDITATGSVTYVEEGNVTNSITYTTGEAFNSNNYTITKSEGTLSITPITTQITVTAQSDEKVYDGTPLTKPAVTCTAGVLLEGDRLVATVSGSQTDRGQSNNVVTGIKVMRGDTDVTGNYTFGESQKGTLTVKPRAIELTSGSAEKTYDGTPLTKHVVTVTSGSFVQGEGFDYTVTGSQTYAGNSKNTFTWSAKEGTNSDNYEVTTVLGDLHVKQSADEITIKAPSDSKMYDGTPLTLTAGATYSGKLASGDTLMVTLKGSQTDAGSSAVTVASYRVVRTVDGTEKDVTESYTFGASVPGTVTVTKRDVVLTSGSDKKTYDGTPLTKDEVTVSGDGFADGEGATYEVTGSQLDAGRSNNTFSYELNSNTKAGNYSITMQEGELIVSPIKEKMITITADSDSKTYDGQPLTNSNYTYTDGVLVDGDVLTAVVEGSVTNVDDVNTANVVTSYRVLRGTTDVTGNYTFTASVNGTLTVTPREITLTSATDDKPYDGKALTNDTVTVSDPGFVAGEGATYEVTGTQTLVGSSDNTFDYTLNDGTKAANYTIKKVYGTLTVVDDDVDPDTVVTKTHENKADGGRYDLGETVTFTITVTNPYDTAKTITLTEQGGVTLADTVFENVAPGARVTTTATYTITEADVKAGSYHNTVTAAFSGGKSFEGEDTVEVEDGKAHLTVIKEAATQQPEGGFKLGDTIEYTIRVKNDGNLTVDNIEVTDDLTGDVLTFGTLAGHTESEPQTVRYTVTEKDILSGKIINKAEVTKATDPDGNTPETTPGSAEVDTESAKPVLVVNKAVVGKTSGYELGETVTYSISVTNTGNVTVENVWVKDDLTGQELFFGTVAPGQTVPAPEKPTQIIYTVTEQDILNGEVVNVATISKGQPKGGKLETVPGTATITTVAPAPAMKVNKRTTSTAPQGGYKVGDVITYAISVTNTGNVTLHDVKVSDALTGNVDGKVLDFGTIAPKATSEEVTVSYTVTEADVSRGKVINEALGTAKDPKGKDPEVTPGKTTDETEPKNSHITVTKKTTSTMPEGGYKLGDTITYEITVKNDGNQTLTNVQISDTLAGLVKDDEAAWTIPSLGINESRTVTAHYVVTEADIRNGKVVNDATVTGAKDPDGEDPKVTPGKTEDDTVPKNSHITVTKHAVSTPKDAAGYGLGEEIQYEITVENDGNQTLTDVTIEDTLAGIVKDVPADWTDLTLKPGDKVTVTARYTVTEADIRAGHVHNEATISAMTDPDGPVDPDPEDPEKPKPVTPGTDDQPTVKEESSLFISKTADKTSGLKAGDVVTYTILVVNNGNQTISNIVVNDELTGDSFDGKILGLGGITLKPGEKREFTVRYTITETDVIRGGVTNVATVKGTDPNGGKIDEKAEENVDTEPANPNYSVTKTVDNPQAEYKVGDVIRYTIRITNTGNLTLNNLTVKDQMQGASGTAVIAAQNGVTVNGQTATIARLAVGATIELKASYTVVREDADGTLSNRVNVTTDKPGTDPKDPDAPEVPGKEDETDPTPTEKTYVLTIHYVDANGNVLAEDYTARLLAGEMIDAVVSPAINGYTPNFRTVSLPATGMPARDVTITVIYTANPVVVPDQPQQPNDPNNGGNNGGGNADNNGGNNGGNNAGNNPANPADTTPADGVIQPNDDGGYDLTPVEDGQTPLANMDLDDHACCILHFLIMLLTLIIFALYTKSRKNRQMKVEELREELAIATIQKELDLSDEDMAKYLEEAKKLAEEKKQANA